MHIFRYSVRITLLALVLLVFIGGFMFFPDSSEPAADNSDAATGAEAEEQVIAEYYAPLVPMRIGDVPVEASLATTPAERQQGLSDTPYLPAHVVKVFVFPEAKQYSFWMKDMQYPIDIIWVDAAADVVDIHEAVAPETYPETFTPSQPAQYVIETVAGFAAEQGITVGTEVDLPSILGLRTI